ncbi:MAG: hypothetical protein V4466_16815, partial [Pseudomonadota bacterium]
ILLDPLLPILRKAHPTLSLGSYPFFSNEGFGSNLVIRGRDAAELATTVDELAAALKEAGIANVAEPDPV